MIETILAVQGLRKSYDDVVAVDGLDFEIESGQCFGLLGPNGAGKSTMIKVLVGENPPTQGKRWVHPEMRFAYVAQHAFHPIEQHLDKTPVQYVQWYVFF